MSYVDKILQPKEEILAVGRMHWIVYVPGAVLLLLSIGIALSGAVAPERGFIFTFIGGAVGLFGVYVLIGSWIEAVTTEIAVTNRRVIHKRGLIRRETGEMNMEKVESVNVDQTILGRVLGYGSIVVRGTGAGIEGLHHIADPLSLRSAIIVR